MNAAQIHLALNHLPLAALLFGLLFAGWNFLRPKDGALRAGLVLFIMAAVSVGPAYLSGENTEEIVEHKPGVSESFIENHEEAAEPALVATIATGIAALLALVLLKRGSTYSKRLAVITEVLALVAIGLMANTAHLGGQIRHDEIRTATPP